MSREFGYNGTNRASYVTPEQFGQHFEQHFRSDVELEKPENVPPEISDFESFEFLQASTCDVDEGPPTPQEIQAAIRTLNNNRSWGTDALPMELLTHHRRDHEYLEPSPMNQLPPGF